MNGKVIVSYQEDGVIPPMTSSDLANPKITKLLPRNRKSIFWLLNFRDKVLRWNAKRKYLKYEFSKKNKISRIISI